MKYISLLLSIALLPLFACTPSGPDGFTGGIDVPAKDLQIRICIGYGDGVSGADVKIFGEEGAAVGQWFTDGDGWFELLSDDFDYTEEQYTFVASKGRYTAEFVLPERPNDNEEFCLEDGEDVARGVADTEWDRPSQSMDTLGLDYVIIEHQSDNEAGALFNILYSSGIASHYQVLMFGEGQMDRIEEAEPPDGESLEVTVDGLVEAIEAGTSIYLSGTDASVLEWLFPDAVEFVGDDADVEPTGEPVDAHVVVHDDVLQARLDAVIDSDAQRLVFLGSAEPGRDWMEIESVAADVDVLVTEEASGRPLAVSFQPFGPSGGTVMYVVFANQGSEVMTPGARTILSEFALRL